MQTDKLIEIAIEDGTIKNATSASVSVTQKKTKRWAALVTKDMSQPGGMDRKFLDNRDSGRVVILKDENLEGRCIEMAEVIDTYTKEVGRDYKYFLVESAFVDRLYVRQIKAAEVPRASVPKVVTADRTSILLSTIVELRAEIAVLKKQLGQGEEQRVTAKNIVNRVKRKLHKSGRGVPITYTEVIFEIDQAVRSLRKIGSPPEEQSGTEDGDLNDLNPEVDATSLQPIGE